MAISEVFIPGLYYRTLRAEYRVEGDNPWAAYTNREAAEKREAELAAEQQPNTD